MAYEKQNFENGKVLDASELNHIEEGIVTLETAVGKCLTSETDPTVPAWAKASKKPTYTAAEVGADASGTAFSRVATHNTDTTAHADIRNDITAVAKSSDIVCATTGDVITIADSSDRELQGLKVFGKTTQDGIPTPESPLDLVSVGNAGSITVCIGTSDTDESPQTLTISTPNGLPGIPVTSGGNYTDETGQQWVCDEVDFEKGVYVQRVFQKVIDGNVSLSNFLAPQWKTNVVAYFNTKDNELNKCGVGTLSDYLTGKDHPNKLLTEEGISRNPTVNGFIYIGLTFTRLGIEPTTDAVTGVNAVKTYLSEHPITILYELLAPIENALSADELTAYAALHTNYPNTTVFNDGGAGMEVKYVADTKLYVDKKFAELSTALLNQ